MKLKEIKINKANPRIIKDFKFKKLCNSIKEFPKMLELRPIVIDTDGTILGGNMRYKALQELGYKEVPDTWVRRADELTDKEKQRFIIEDNVGFGDWDFDMLANDWDFANLQDWGVDLPDYSDTFNENTSEQQEAQEVEIDENQVQPKVQKGDIWQLGKHRLMCGDSTDKNNIKRLLNGTLVDLCFTSPPYNVAVPYVKDKYVKSKRMYLDNTNVTYNEYSDDLSDEEYKCFLSNSLKAVIDVCDDVLFNIGCVSGALKGTAGFLGENADFFKGFIGWRKSGAFNPMFPSQNGCLCNILEPIYYFNNRNTRKFAHNQWNNNEQAMYNIVETQNASGNEYAKIHSATFPIQLPEYFIKNFTETSILDIFGGTGTTLIAAEQLNRQCFMMELDAKYCDVIIARWEKLTGETAVKVE